MTGKGSSDHTEETNMKIFERREKLKIKTAYWLFSFNSKVNCLIPSAVIGHIRHDDRATFFPGA